jgi:hypothetical protein
MSAFAGFDPGVRAARHDSSTHRFEIPDYTFTGLPILADS